MDAIYYSFGYDDCCNELLEITFAIYVSLSSSKLKISCWKTFTVLR